MKEEGRKSLLVHTLRFIVCVVCGCPMPGNSAARGILGKSQAHHFIVQAGERILELPRVGAKPRGQWIRDPERPSLFLKGRQYCGHVRGLPFEIQIFESLCDLTINAKFASFLTPLRHSSLARWNTERVVRPTRQLLYLSINSGKYVQGRSESTVCGRNVIDLIPKRYLPL